MAEQGQPRLTAVVAMGRNGVIGQDGQLPWRLSTDLKRYRSLTMGKPMIMGRKTIESIGRALDRRDTIVLTHRPEIAIAGVFLAHSPQEALRLAGERAAERGVDEIIIAGGGEIYAEFLDRLDRLAITHVDADPAGDARFPAIDWDGWTVVTSEDVPSGPKDDVASRHVVYERR
ncbi:dihydrofolate reductase [Mangrovicella endophytica]|uniref:dihydrofolate reductase n=1 Tax=Mangrovicella endophytica TaxID=2066697 RepID=UPI000C9E3215|nr:dihydrofolate reductase [Mangrovicella endophytica]